MHLKKKQNSQRRPHSPTLPFPIPTSHTRPHVIPLKKKKKKKSLITYYFSVLLLRNFRGVWYMCLKIYVEICVSEKVYGNACNVV